MINTKTFFTVLCFFVFLSKTANAQLRVYNEIGILAGPAAFFTDYGERWNIRSNLDNGGFGVGIVHYMHFAYRRHCNIYRKKNYLADHFRIRNEIDYMRSNLEHVGPVAMKKTKGGEQLRAMHGYSETIEIGTHLEYYPFSISDFTNFSYWLAPYIGLGFHYVRYFPDAYSDLGSFKTPGVLFPTFEDGLNLEDGHTTAIAGNLGLRYHIAPRHDILMEARWQYYDTDWLEGLNIQAKQNQYNDFIFWFNIGYVYYINL
ncbi:THC0290_0291 family protein [Salegentibacter chungangensis]|uniref:Glutamate dehydrogenase n=1 Tax=Salegentibacter chungangensis TaxID=1335724 RepID=A0ABW3NMG7_9FLAO